MNRLILAACAAACALAAAPGLARAGAADPPQILALVVTNNHSSETGRPELHYADDDGAKYFDLFRMLGGDDDVELLTDFDRDSAQLFPDAVARAHTPTRAEVANAAARLAARARAAASAGRTTELYFVFAGHGDVDRGRGFLELRDGRLDSDGLAAILHQVGATRAHVILDSCNSFFVLSPRKPGGRRVAVTEQAAQSLGERLPNVGVFLSTSAEAEVFEWSELQSGIFSHAVRSGLAGAADANHDGIVSYDELRAFVEIATSRVKNPLYRPKIFARAPEGHGEAAIVELAHAKARRIELAAGDAMRLTVRDPDELPWLDVNAERGAALTLLVPERWAQHAAIDEHAPDGSVSRIVVPAGDDPIALGGSVHAEARLAARGPNDVLATLFDAPFGPQAYAQWREQPPDQRDDVYGVSSEDVERMRLILAQVSATERGSRKMIGAGLVGIGALAAASPTLVSGLDSSARLDFEVAGAAVGLGGLAALLVPSKGERLYDDFVAAMANPNVDHSLAVAQTEQRLDAMAREWRRYRHLMFALGLSTGAVAATGLVLSMHTTGLDLTRYSLAGAGALSGMIVVASLMPTPVEQMHELWIGDPDLGRMPRFEVSVAPTSGGATLGLSGRF